MRNASNCASLAKAGGFVFFSLCYVVVREYVLAA
jgi:hypothetical protein